MKIHATDLENLTPGARQAILTVLNAPLGEDLDTQQRRQKSLAFTVAAQRRLKRKRLKDLQSTAHVVKRGNWGLVEVSQTSLLSGLPKARWSRGSGKRWPLEDAERFAKLFGGTVQRFP